MTTLDKIKLRIMISDKQFLHVEYIHCKGVYEEHAVTANKNTIVIHTGNIEWVKVYRKENGKKSIFEYKEGMDGIVEECRRSIGIHFLELVALVQQLIADKKSMREVV